MEHSEIMSQFDSHDLLRNVVETPLQFPNGDTVPDKKALLFEDDGSYISTVGKNYNIIQNERVFDKMTQSLLNSGLDLDGLTIDTSSSTTGARNLAMITLPSHSIETSTGDLTHMQLLARNSYDGSWKQQVEIGGFRMACANGQVDGDASSVYANRHTTGFDIETMAQYLAHSIDVFAEMGQQWATMQGTPITRQKALNRVLDYLGKKPRDNADRQKMLSSERAKTVQEMIASWDRYSNEMGANVFALYNTLTDHATHVEDGKADALSHRRKQVTRIITNVMH